jgi:hypothetical protein
MRRQDLRGLALRRGRLLLDAAVTLELLLLTTAALGLLALTLLGGAAERVLEALGVDDADGGRVALRLDPEVPEAADDLTVLEAHLLGELVHADGVAHWFTLLATPDDRRAPSPRARSH